jgi:hypothetical protein
MRLLRQFGAATLLLAPGCRCSSAFCFPVVVTYVRSRSRDVHKSPQQKKETVTMNNNQHESVIEFSRKASAFLQRDQVDVNLNEAAALSIEASELLSQLGPSEDLREVVLAWARVLQHRLDELTKRAAQIAGAFEALK